MRRGFTLLSSSYPKPSLSMVPGLKFSRSTSHRFTSSRKRRRPSGCLRLRVMLRFPLLRLT